MSFIDLHIHTTASDGTFSPKEVVEEAVRRGLSVIAITDHDTTQGIPEALEAIEDYYGKIDSRKVQVSSGMENEEKLILVPGVEISCWYDTREVHMLGLFIDYTNDEFNEKLKAMEEERDRRNDKMIEMFNEHGIFMTLEDLKFGQEDTVVSRAHFARYLEEHGYVKSREEAFKKYIGDGCPFYLSRNYISAETAIQWIHQVGGMAFLAHPYLYGFKEDKVRKMLNDLKEFGLDGLEAYHSTADNGRTNQLRAYAKKLDLMVSGGSDFHGGNKPYIYMGVGKGNLRITRHVYDTIMKRMV
jgi:predicted metal-dependent phosphoesterase TrpH